MSEILAKLGFEWRMALANLVNFLIIFWLLKKYAFGPLKKTIDARQDKVNQGIQDAEKAKSELVMAEENYKNKISQAKQDANQIISQASEQGKNIVNTAQQSAETKYHEMLEQGKQTLHDEKQKMMQEVKQETVGLAMQVAEKILGDNLDKEKNEKIVKNLIKEK